jgi:hypothetical protein
MDYESCAASKRPGCSPIRPILKLANSWQIRLYGGMREKRKVRTAAYLLMIVMVGLGGLEPPTSPLSGLLWCYRHSIMLSFAKTPHHSEFRPRNNVTSPLHACHFKCILSFGEAGTPAAASRYIINVVQLKLGAAPSTRTGHIAGLAPLPRDPRASTVRVGGDARPKKRR